MNNLTEKEKNVLQAICENEYQDCNGEEVVGNRIWMITDFDTKKYGIVGKELSGVCSSLSKKGYMCVDKDGKDSTCWITKEGYEALNSK